MKRVLFINPFGIGDVIFSLTALEAARRAWPDARIGFLCNERTVDLVRMDRSIDQTYVFNRSLFRRLQKKQPLLFFRKLRALLGVIGGEKFDTFVDFSLGREYAFFARWLGIRTRIGLDFKGRGLFLNRKIKITGYHGRSVVDVQLEALKLIGIDAASVSSRLPLTIADAARQEAAALLKANGISERDKILAIAPGGGRSWGQNARYKQWNAPRFGQAAARLAERHGFKILLVGDRLETGALMLAAETVRSPKAVAAGQPLGTVAALLARSSMLICNDGGLLHLANALGVKTVSVFGPVDENVYGPYGSDTPHEVVTEQVPCRPCYADFRFPGCGYDRRCLNDITVDRVVAAAEKIA